MASSSNSAITAAERRRRTGLALALVVAACARPEVRPAAPPVSIAPEIRIALALGAASVALGGGAELTLSEPDGGGITVLPAGTVATVTPEPTGLQWRIAGEPPRFASALTAAAADTFPVRLNGRDYRGHLLLTRSAGGVLAVNRLDLESYVLGVGGAEMGRRTEQDLAALRAQAVVSRTLGLKAIGRWRLRGYDLVSTVADQAYAGIGFESPVSTQATRETRGEILTWEGQPIDVFFHSTCGGRTADGPEVFAGAERPYLRSIRDEDEGGHAWCAISPRYRWQESWTGEALARTLRETLPAAVGTSELADQLRDIRVLDRTATGRVARLELVGKGTSRVVTGPAARLLLRTADGSILRSANFNLQVTRSGNRIIRLDVVGSGAGHGVGMCQWGALGRSRAGYGYRDILSAYFPGTEISHTY
ncbi:MAG TPA: SpoIID/LytB domain-containing protein [Gemmatimonadales bacterium]|nr:SpoIID/LytB domain-containing protein [Gemmatimonadales bacterium]